MHLSLSITVPKRLRGCAKELSFVAIYTPVKPGRISADG